MRAALWSTLRAACLACFPAKPAHRHVMAQLTGQFQELSRQVLAAEAGLRAAGQGELAGLLRTVQVTREGLQWAAMPQGGRPCCTG